ncbi:hypothetical protein [Flavobacterium sp. 3HN19-14]|uniref:hypothetical protein n=1 Tax=Flavobacterium sp. 3HN19-14 TaxID=3448133 RepID=UPI003EE0761A
MGGFECSDPLNSSGKRINLLHESRHDLQSTEDYQKLAALGIKTVREGICWSKVEIQPYLFDFTEVKNRMNAAEEHGIQQIWDLCHFGYPDGLYPAHPNFCIRFMALCQAFALFYKDYSSQPLFVVPINEIGFIASHSADKNGVITNIVREDFELKYNLCKAAITGIRQLKRILPECHIVLVEPLVKIHQSINTNPEQFYHRNENQFQAIDIISGRYCSELGGDESFVDVIGFNYYWNSQWEDQGESLPWPETEEKRVPLSSLLKMAYRRYEKPIFLSGNRAFWR